MSGFLGDELISENEIEEACRQRRAECKSLLDLTSSNPTINGYTFPKEILVEEARRYFSDRKYTPDSKGYQKAREAVCKYYKSRISFGDINPEQVFLTASTSEAYSLLFSLLCDPGDNLLSPSITYPLFEFLADHHRIKLKNYDLIATKNAWDFDWNSFERAKTVLSRGVLIVSPHNPTGHILSEYNPKLASLGLPLICDEVFAEFSFGIEDVPPLNTLYPDVPVFLLNGISKMFALPDMKLGWIVLNDIAYERYAERLEILNDTFLGANGFMQSALPAIFEKGVGFTRQMVASVNTKIQVALELLQTSPLVEVIPPQGGYYLFPKIKLDCDEEQLVISLINKGVLVHPGSFYGAEDGPRIMISCLVKEEVLYEGVKLLISELGQLR